jgi:hypothetical protein
MNDLFKVWYPFRWFFAIIAVMILCMSYADTTGWRLMSFSGSGRGGSYYGGPTGHK